MSLYSNRPTLSFRLQCSNKVSKARVGYGIQAEFKYNLINTAIFGKNTIEHNYILKLNLVLALA